MQDAKNGHAPPEIRLPPGELRRVARLHARMEGALGTAQVAYQAAQQAQQQFREALNEACAEAGLEMPVGTPPDTPVDIDWKTGVVTVDEPVPPRSVQGAPIGRPT
jgi:hypothetical protein